VAGDRHVAVAWEAEHDPPLADRVDHHQVDRVGAAARGRAAAAELRGAGVRPDHQEGEALVEAGGGGTGVRALHDDGLAGAGREGPVVAGGHRGDRHAGGERDGDHDGERASHPASPVRLW
jgi:hypothetical protein